MNLLYMRGALILLGCVAAVFLGRIAGEGGVLLPVALLLLTGFLLFCVWRGVQVESACVSLLVVGYFAANRGFAQLSPLGGLPLFFAEIGLGLSLGMVTLRTALKQRLPFPLTPLAIALLVWIGAAGVHLLLDLPQWGLMALRDYAAVFYALFFFIAFSLGRHAPSRSLLLGGFGLGLGLMVVVYPLFLTFEHFFTYTLTFRGMPLIYFKDDLAGIYGGAGAVFFYGFYRRRGGMWRLLLALACLAMIFLTLSRAAMLGLGVGVVLLLLARDRGFVAMLIGAGTAAVVALLLYYSIAGTPLRETRLYGFYEHVASLVDVSGTREYRGQSSHDTGANNRFRLVWWQTLAGKTLDEAPLFGLGFGYDLAAPFVQEYYPGSDREAFTARSPHNYLLTLFARTGVLGLVLFLVVLVLMAGQTCHWLGRARAGPSLPEPLLLQIMCWTVLASALFQVVLEGPMGAVPFWLLLGLSQVDLDEPAEETEASTTGAAAAS